MKGRAQNAGDASLCVCGSGAKPEQCCLPYIDFTALAPSAQALMRSRYTAYTLNRVDYLLRTWHPHTRPVRLEVDEHIRWLGLQLKHHSAGLTGDQEGTVEFVARFKIGSRADRIHENSRFVFANGAWLYIDGEVKHQPRLRPGRQLSKPS